MTDIRTAAQHLLGALDKSLYMNDYSGLEVSKHDQPDVTNAIENLRAELAEPHPLYGWVFKRNADGSVGIFAPPPKPGESKRTSDCVGTNQRDLHELLGKLADHMAALAEPFSPEAISATQTAWKMGYEARKAEEQTEPDSPERRCGGPGCDGTCCQPVRGPQGCDHCNHPLYAAIKCRVCGRAT